MPLAHAHGLQTCAHYLDQNRVLAILERPLIEQMLPPWVWIRTHTSVGLPIGCLKPLCARKTFSQFNDVLNVGLNRFPPSMNAHLEELLPRQVGAEVAALTESFAKVLHKE